MKPVRIVVLGVAAVAAVGLAVLVRGALSGKPTSQASAAVPLEKPKPMTKVLVAKRDLRVGERLTEQDMDWKDWPVDAVNVAMITDGSVPVPTAQPAAGKDGKDAKDGKDGKPAEAAPPPPPPARGKSTLQKDADGNPVAEVAAKTLARIGQGGPKAQFVNAVVRQPFLAGEPIMAAKIVRAGESGYLSVVLDQGMRAMSIPVTVETAAGGFILPGDRVDVIMSREVQSNGAQNWVSGTVLRNMKVLAVDQVTKPEKDATTVVGATATLEVGPQDAETLALAKASGTLSLVLRSYADVNAPSGRAQRVPQNGHPGAPGANGLGGAGMQSRSVRVFRNGEPTDVAVNS